MNNSNDDAFFFTPVLEKKKKKSTYSGMFDHYKNQCNVYFSIL